MALWRLLSPPRIRRFQFSIGDACIQTCISSSQAASSVSILYWRCEGAHQVGQAEERRLFVFQFSIGDALGVTLEPAIYVPSFRFNSLLEMLETTTYTSNSTAATTVSILYWRCAIAERLVAMIAAMIPVSILYWRCRRSQLAM